MKLITDMAKENYSTMEYPLPISNLKICPGNCSGNGDCLSGMCLCGVQYSGWSCSDRNLSYFLSFGVIFYMVCLMAIVQLILCIRSDFFKLKRPNIYRACKLNIQKIIYISIIFATGSRAVYFSLGLHDVVPKPWKENLFSTFYPFVLSGFSVIICFWAESFHLTGLQLDRPRNLTKSYCAFVGFNIFVYVMLVAQVVSNHIAPLPLATKLNEIFNGCFAFLMFFTLVFFLIYGVEIFCKVEGAFKPTETFETGTINLRQLFQSRLGLVAQASFQLAVTMFLMSEVLGEMWKQKMSIGDRNIVEIMFHVAELACALWFPCCLWNVSKPGELWILNPKNLLIFRRASKEETSLVQEVPPPTNYNTFDGKEDPGEIRAVSGGDCWICYDSENTDRLIQPCDCKGGMELVHHDCLKKWLLERPFTGSDKDRACCTVCKVEYNVTRDNSIVWKLNGLQVKTWSQTFFVVVTMASLPVTLFFVWNKISRAPVKLSLVFGMCIGEYLLLRLLGFNFLKAYKITKTRAMRILGRHEKCKSSSVCSSSSTCSASSETESHLSVTVDT